MLVTFPSPVSIGELHRTFTLGQGIVSAPETMVNAFTVNSASVEPGCLFIACRGASRDSSQDGHAFLEQAYAKGAVAAVVADIESLGGKAGFETSNARVLVSRLSNFAYQNPSGKLKVIGITGTNGKTSTNWFIYHALKNLEQKSMRVGTLGYEIDSVYRSDDSLTTPVAESLHALIDLAVKQECRYAVLEISSHALHQHRVDDIAFDAAIFTNISHDHLDYHHTFEEYFHAKRRLFELMLSSKKSSRIASFNLDTEAGQKLSTEFSGKFDIDASYSYRKATPVVIKEIETKHATSTFRFEVSGKNLEFEIPFFGSHNAENLAAAIGVLSGFGFSNEELADAFSKIPTIPGRLEIVPRQGYRCFVDFAHTPDALERILGCLKELPHRKLILVFGCGGNRDWRKRSVMGNLAARIADYTIVTSDNPRNEDPDKIIADILDSDLNEGHNCEVISDRAEAIARAMKIAQPNDIVLVAGKGHETYQITGEEKKYFSDQEQIRNYND